MPALTRYEVYDLLIRDLSFEGLDSDRSVKNFAFVFSTDYQWAFKRESRRLSSRFLELKRIKQLPPIWVF
jgi:hypothetical protein